MDTDWLCVGHIDEYTSFVPDSTAPRGFRYVYADTHAAWDVIDDLGAGARLPMYEDHGLPSVASFDAGVRNLNADTQEDILDPQLELAREHFGLAEEEILYMPSLFFNEAGCGQAALIPGMVNLIVVNAEDGSHIFMADPFFRDSESSLTGQDEDPIIAAVEEMMPEELNLHFVDNWNVYHLGLGEVHCGTNSTSEPVRWWEEDLTHLLQGGE
jgi:protein-arginine deiminase